MLWLCYVCSLVIVLVLSWQIVFRNRTRQHAIVRSALAARIVALACVSFSRYRYHGTLTLTAALPDASWFPAPLPPNQHVPRATAALPADVPPPHGTTACTTAPPLYDVQCEPYERIKVRGELRQVYCLYAHVGQEIFAALCCTTIHVWGAGLGHDGIAMCDTSKFATALPAEPKVSAAQPHVAHVLVLPLEYVMVCGHATHPRVE